MGNRLLGNGRENSVRYLFCKAPEGPLRGKRYRTLFSRSAKFYKILFAILLGLIVVAITARPNTLRGWWRPIVVSGPSMSPTLWGPHAILSCDECQWSGKIHQLNPTTRRLPCFRCGNHQRTQVGPLVSGSKVRIDRAAFWFQSPQAGDLVAIENSSGELAVKRVIGTPGDLIQIDHRGRILLNKNLYYPTIASPNTKDRWGIEVYDYIDHPPRASRLTKEVSSPWDYLYTHRNIHNRLQPDVIRDDDPANATLRRQMRPVDHLLLEIQVACQRPGGIEVVAELTNQRIRKTGALVSGEQRVYLELDITDANDDAFDYPVELSATSPIAIRFVGTGETELLDFQIGRTVRYDPPEGQRQRWLAGVRVPEGRYIVMGDNAAASEDSRQYPDGVAIGSIRGRVEF